MYCKNCGKKLPDGARFCDRCNMSVRKKGDKKDLIVELKQERLARRQAKAVEERLRKIKKIKHKRYKNKIVIAVLILAAGIVSGIIGWAIIDPVSKNTDNGIVSEEKTAEPEKKPNIVTASPSPESESAAELNADGYYITEISGMKFAYPRGFEKCEAGDGVLFTFKEVMGDAVLNVGRADTDLQPKDLMERYYGDVGGTVLKSRAGEKEYEISLTTGNEFRHRKSCISGGTEIYYEMSYPSDSKNIQQYEENIKYMDEFFTNK